MGCEIRRVPAGFDWPMGQVWEGFVRPDGDHPTRCVHCNGTGMNAATREVWDTFYDSNGFGTRWVYDYGSDPDGNPATRPPWRVVGTSLAWHTRITQDEVDALVAADRLVSLTHTWENNTWVRRDGYHPTADEVNHWAGQGMGHDGINMAILVRTRAIRLGVYGSCEHCGGESYLFRDEEHRAAYEGWTKTPVPVGEWWQVWENVTDGSPVTPAFATAEELADHLMEHGDAWSDGKRWSAQAVRSLFGDGFAMSLTVTGDGRFVAPYGEMEITPKKPKRRVHGGVSGRGQILYIESPDFYG